MLECKMNEILKKMSKNKEYLNFMLDIILIIF